VISDVIHAVWEMGRRGARKKKNSQARVAARVMRTILAVGTERWDENKVIGVCVIKECSVKNDDAGPLSECKRDG
jgi:hypothetical protein